MPTCPILIGRDAELARLREALASSGEVVLISGEAGIGKTRLLRDFTQEARQLGYTIVWGRPEIMTSPGPFSLILDLLENIAASLRGSAADDALSLAEQLSNPTAKQLARTASVTRSAAARIRGILASDSSLPILVLEDLHAVDSASLEVVFHIGRTAPDDSRLVLTSSRPESWASGNQLTRVLEALRHDGVLTQLDLARLSPDETVTAIAAIVGHSPQPSLVKDIIALAEGNPFFVEELIPLGRDDSPEGAVQVRGSIRDIVIGDVELLSSELQSVLRVSSLLAGGVEPELVAAACELSIGQVNTLMLEGRRAGLLADGDVLVFRHAIVRHIVDSASSSDERVANCLRLARAFEALHGASPAHAWQLATLFESAGLPREAADHALRAGRHALSLAATSDARAAFLAAGDWAVDDSTLRQAKEGLAVVELREGNDVAAASLMRDVVELFRANSEDVEAAAALGRLSSILIRAADREGAVEALDEAQSIVQSDREPALTARLMAQKANLLTFYMGRFSEAESFMDQAVMMAEDSSENAVLAVALDGKAEICSCRGDFATAERLGLRSLEVAIASQDAEAIGRTHNNHAVRLVLHGRPQVGIEVLSAGRGYVERYYGSAGVASLDITRAWAYQLMGDPQRALDLLGNLGAIWMVWKGLAAAIKAWAHLERAEPVDAALVLRHAWSDSGFGGWRDVRGHERNLPPDILEILAAEVSVRAGLGELADAAGAAEVYVEASQWSGHPAESTRAHALLGLVYALGAQVSKSEKALLKLDALLGERPFPLWMGMRSEILGILDLSREQRRTAADRFREGATHYASCSNLIDQARCLRRYSEINAREGQGSDQVIESLNRSRELALSAGGLAELSRVEAALRSLGVRPRAGRPRKSTVKRILTAREEQIAALVALGATNAEIAKRLYLSEGTVAGYISSSLRKLDLPGRAALAAWSAKAGLL